MLYFGRISITIEDVIQVFPDPESLTRGSECGNNCRDNRLVGEIHYNEIIAFTVYEGHLRLAENQGQITHLQFVVTDTLGTFVSEPITETEIGKITQVD